MKKILFTACFAMVSLATFAQLPSFGIKGGANFATFTASSNNSNLSVTSGSLTTFNVGVFADFKFGNISLQPALNYTGKGGKISENINTGSSNTTVSLTERLYYLQLPVNLVYHVPAVVGNFYFGAGPYIAEGLSGKVSGDDGSGNNENQKVTFGNADGDLKQMQFGVDGIVGFKFTGGFLINANYDLGLSNDANGSDGKSKSHVFGISAGFAF